MKMDANPERGRIQYGRWHIWADEEQFILFDKLKIRKDGKQEADGHIYYLSSIESLFRRLYQQAIRDSAGECRDLGELVGKAGEIARELEKVICDNLAFKMPSPGQNTG